MTTTQIFSTNIYKSKFENFNLIKDSIKKSLLPHFENLSRNDNYFSDEEERPLSRTLTFNLHKDENLKPVVDYINSCAQEFWKDNNYTKNVIPGITQMWAILTKPGGFTPPHTHNPYPISGSFYVDAPENAGGLYLDNPLEPLLGKMPYEMQWGPTLMFSELVDVEDGSIIMFPGWVKHYSQPNLSNKERVVIAFNFGVDEYFSKEDNS